ncbi:MAG TPA: type VI secretion system tip protein TssI/VgrG [Polyangiaceae bacterium]|nr:type VI secretion system tip protein TssI/VgrG [Polyangiaceae bacterium]
MIEGNKLHVQVASGDALDVRSFSVKQRMSELFRIELTAVSTNLGIALSDVIGNPASFTVRSERSSRTLGGVAIEMRQVKVDEKGLATYTLTIAPTAWLLTQRKNYRIFQFVSELDIVKSLLGEWGVSFEARTKRTYKPRKYRVQYDESDFAFVSRMLEDAGISYYFEPGDGGTKMVLDDAPESGPLAFPEVPFHDTPQVTPIDFVTHVTVGRAVRPGRMTIGDLDYRKPSTSQPRLSQGLGLAQEAAYEQFEYEPGAFLYQGPASGSTPHADDRGASRTDEGTGAQKTSDRLLGKRNGDRVVRLESSILSLAPGTILSIAGHPHSAVGAGGLLVVATTLAGKHDDHWRIEVESAPTSTPRRPALKTPKPKVQGLESATVTGPKGEEIHTDEYGRVRVHFHWDRAGKSDETSSCWLPTSQPWAGTGFGGVNLPRIGQEVLVEFLGGDPDRPVVIGRVYTVTNPPPDPLPKFKTVSGIMSESTPRLVMGAADAAGAGQETSLLGGGQNMTPSEISSEVSQPGPYQAASPTGTMNNWHGSGIKFEDNLESPMIYLQAERDANFRVNNVWRTMVFGDRGCKVGTDDSLEVGNVHAITVHQTHNVRVDGNQTLDVTEKRVESIRNRLSLQVGSGGLHIDAEQDINIAAKKYITMEAKNRIRFTVQGSTIEMLPNSITIICPDGVYFQPQEDGTKKARS